MAGSTNLPKVDVIIPTLNAAAVLPQCLESITRLNYPSNLITVYLIDGGSRDDTLTIAQKFKARVISNPLKTAEAAKAIGIKQSRSPYILLLDSDNIIPGPLWLKELLAPLLESPAVIGAESWAFTYRPRAGFIERYSSLLGANDPYAFFCGIYDRFSLLSQKWTGLNLSVVDKKNYLLFPLNSPLLPTIGANGTLYRTDFLKSNFNGDYFFDIDFANLVTFRDNTYFAKVKNSIIHSYCESSVTKFIRKQQRRVTDFYVYSHMRHHQWSSANRLNSLLFPIYSFSLILPVIDSVRGYLRRPDPAWFFHPLSCLLTSAIYIQGFLKNYLKILQPINRHGWKQ